MVLARARMILRALGIVIRREDGEFRVNFRGGDEATAYYTDDLDDAVETGQDMARRGA